MDIMQNKHVSLPKMKTYMRGSGYCRRIGECKVAWKVQGNVIVKNKITDDNYTCHCVVHSVLYT